MLCCLLIQCLLARVFNLGLVLTHHYHMFVKDQLKLVVQSCDCFRNG